MTNNSYLDVQQKLIFHKENILQNFIKKGIYPTNELIAKYIDDIDLNLAIFKNYDKVTGNKFDTKEYNQSLLFIFKDLSILYNIFNTLCIDEYEKLQNLINSHLTELSSIADTYKEKALYERNDTTLGETLLYQKDNFIIDSNNSTTTVTLKPITVTKGSIIACITNINNTINDNIMFHLYNDENDLNIGPYNIANTTLTIPGDKIRNEYDYEITEDQVINGPILLDIDSDNIDTKNQYKVLGGKNQLFINSKLDNSYSLLDIPDNFDSLLISEPSYINFYVIGGNSITFNFNKKPISTNFPDNQTITNLDYIQHFCIECDSDFILDITLDTGEIYAIKDIGIINNNKLYYTGLDLPTTFKIIEDVVGDEVSYNCQLNIYNHNSTDLDIDNIVIKKLKD